MLSDKTTMILQDVNWILYLIRQPPNDAAEVTTNTAHQTHGKPKMVEAGFLSADHYPTESLSSVRGLESEEQMLRLNNQQDCLIQAGTKGQHAEGTA